MSPRPRTIDDTEILAACQRVMQRVGPARFTLALVADEAGISAATIVQRFGSKRQLLRAIAGATDGMTAGMVAALRARYTSPLATAREFLLCFADMARTPREMANHLAYLQLDLADPVMHRHFLRLSIEQQDALRALLDEAQAAGELVRTDSATLARVLGAVVTGGLLAWATFREGTAREWLARDLDAVLAPWRVRPRAARRSR